MVKKVLAALAMLMGLGISLPASSAVITSLVGDKDCFGLGGSCPDGTLWRDQLGGSFFNNYSTASDPTFTDRWFADLGLFYSHSYSLGSDTPLSAQLTIRGAGIGDSRGPWDVFFGGTLIGQFPTRTTPNAFQEVVTYIFAIPVALLTGSDSVLLNINVPTLTDGYSIDFSELTVTTRDSAVPEPTSLILAGLGLVALAAMRRRKRA